LTTDQLNQARAEQWRQAGNPLLTADDAAAWLHETGVCLFLPRSQQLATAAPSFVEAVLGASDATPKLATIETATEMLHRLLASGDAIALNLLSTPGEQPDFLATEESLPFLFALAGDKEWKRGPRGKSSPLVIEVWKLLDREGPLTTVEVKDKLGRQLTETAALRALTELWSHLRIEPVFEAGKPAAWQLLERNRQKQMQAGSTMSQAVALSALVSLYLQSAVAASGEEVEIFLSPLASRSKIRDVLKGLTATRQLGTMNLGPVEMYHLEGGLPELAGAPLVAGAADAGVSDAEVVSEGLGEGRRRFVASRIAANASGGPASGAPAAEVGRAPSWNPPPGRASRGQEASGHETSGQQSLGRPSFGGAFKRPAAEAGRPQADGSSERKPFAPRPGAPGGTRKPYGTRAPGGSSFHPREPWKEDQSPAKAHGEGEDRRPFAVRQNGTGERKPFAPREGAERKPFSPRGDRPFKPREESGSSGERKSIGARKAFAPREGAERRPFAAREGAERRPFAPREGGPGERKPFAPREGGAGRKPFAPRGDRPFKSRSEAGSHVERKSFGAERKPFAPREGAERRPFPPREGGPGERKAYTPREGADRRPFTPRQASSGERKPFIQREGAGRKPFAPRPGGPAGERRNAGRPWTPREGAGRPAARREGGKPLTPRPGAKPFGERKPFTPREGGSKPTGGGYGDRPFKPRPSATKPFGGRKSFGERKSFGGPKPFAPRSSGESRAFTPREGGERKPFTPRESRDRKLFAPRDGGKPAESRGGDRPLKPRVPARPSRPTDPAGDPGTRQSTRPQPAPGSRPDTGRERSFPPRTSSGPRTSPRPSAGSGAGRTASGGVRKVTGFRKSPGMARDRTSPLTSSGKPRTGVRPPSGRPGTRAKRGDAPGAHPRTIRNAAGVRGVRRTSRPQNGPASGPGRRPKNSPDKGSGK
jgi:hypothetical protein